MKHSLLLLLFSFQCYTVLASDSTIVFKNYKDSNLFEIAKKENKGVMLYFHFNGCGACLRMEKSTFKDSSVYNFYNDNFINFSINTLKGSGIEINKIYNIEMHPTFIYFDSNGNEVHRIVGYYNSDEFYNHGLKAISLKNNLAFYKNEYIKGYRTSDFLYEYTYMLRDANELEKQIVNEYIHSLGNTDYKLEKNIKYIYEFCIHNFNIYFPFESVGFEFILNNKNKFSKYVDSNQVNVRIYYIASDAVKKAILMKDEAKFAKSIGILELFEDKGILRFREIDGRTTGIFTTKNIIIPYKLAYYEATGDKERYKSLLNFYTAKIWNDSEELNNYAWNIYENSNKSDSKKLKHGLKCAKRSLELNNTYASNDTYAWLLFKIGKHKKAYSQALKAIDVAKIENREYGETQKLLDLIK